MKKIFVLSMILVSMLFVSCTDDYTDPKVLSGTTWRCTDFSSVSDFATTYDYLEYRFTSTTDVEGWSKEKNAAVQKDGTATYSIKGNVITINSDGGSESLTIDKKR